MLLKFYVDIVESPTRAHTFQLCSNIFFLFFHISNFPVYMFMMVMWEVYRENTLKMNKLIKVMLLRFYIHNNSILYLCAFYVSVLNKAVSKTRL